MNDKVIEQILSKLDRIETKVDNIETKVDKLSDELRIVKDQTATLTEFKTTVKTAGEMLYKNIV